MLLLPPHLHMRKFVLILYAEVYVMFKMLYEKLIMKVLWGTQKTQKQRYNLRPVKQVFISGRMPLLSYFVQKYIFFMFRYRTQN